MSELKAFDVVLGRYSKDGSPCIVAIDADRNPQTLDEKVYLKAEADRYITRQKYKRCLANADLNWWQSNRYSAAEMVERIRGNFEEARQCSELEHKYYKRYKIWLTLAQKFK